MGKMGITSGLLGQQRVQPHTHTKRHYGSYDNQRRLAQQEAMIHGKHSVKEDLEEVMDNGFDSVVVFSEEDRIAQYEWFFNSMDSICSLVGLEALPCENYSWIHVDAWIRLSNGQTFVHTHKLTKEYMSEIVKAVHAVQTEEDVQALLDKYCPSVYEVGPAG